MINETARNSAVLPTELPQKLLPGPKGNAFFGRLVRSSRRDPLRFMTTLAREYGDVSTFRLGTERVVFVNHPDYVRAVLVNHYSNFLKGAGRWTPEGKAARPHYSYFPFGGGPRRCLGESFAMVEGVLLLASLARNWRLRLVPGHTVEVFPEHLLRAKHGMLMTIEKR